MIPARIRRKMQKIIIQITIIKYFLYFLSSVLNLYVYISKNNKRRTEDINAKTIWRKDLKGSSFGRYGVVTAKHRSINAEGIIGFRNAVLLKCLISLKVTIP